MLEFFWHPRKRSEPASSSSPDFGLKVLHNEAEAVVDIVAIHGLGGNSHDTWKAANGKMWLRDMLPSSVPVARIMTFGYDTEPSGSRNLYRKLISSPANKLISALAILRKKTESTRRPLIFVGHSFGGLIIKRALLRSNSAEDDEEDIKAIKSMTLGIIFLGTPHQGSRSDSFAEILQKVAYLNRTTFCEASDSHCLEMDLDQFKSISSGFLIFCCYETLPTTSTLSIIVPELSATMGGLSLRDSKSIALNADHSDLCKFSRSDDADYRTIAELFRRFEERRVQQNTSKLQGKVLKPRKVSIKDDFKIPFVLGGRSQNPSFTGRKMALEQLHDHVTGSNRLSRASPVIVIHGVGGMGKTQLALEYAHLNRYCYNAIFWIDAQNVRSVQTSFLEIAQSIVLHYAHEHDDQGPPYLEIARHLGLEDMVDKSGKIETDGLPASLFVNAVREWLGRNGNTNWLLIFDDSDGFEYTELSTYFPDTLIGRIFVTRRLRPTGRSFESIELNAMEEQEACKLLLKGCRSNYSETDRKVGVRIVQTLGYNPLAISQAASYVSEAGVTLGEYLRLLDLEVEKQTNGERFSLGALRKFSESTLHTWEISLGAIKEQNPTAASLLHLCAYFACDNIPIEMLSLGTAQHLQFRQSLTGCISALRSDNFVRSAQNAESFSIHYLLQEWLRERQVSRSEALGLEQAMVVIAFAALAFKRPQSRRWVFEREIVPHITACFHWKTPIFWYEAELVECHHWIALGIICEHWGKHDDAEQLFKLANYKIASSKPGLSQAHLQLEIGTFYMRRGQIDQARELFRAALSTAAYESNDGGESSEYASQLRLKSLVNCALTPEEGALLTESESQFKHALEESEVIFGLNHPQTIDIVDILATEYRKHDQYQKAEMTWRRELLSLEIRLGSGSPILISKQCVLANVCQLQGRYSEAEKLFKQALTSYEQRLGADHPSSLDMVLELAILSDLQGKFEESQQLYERVLVGRQRTLGLRHPKTLIVLENQALSYRMQGKYEEASQFYRRVLRSREETMDSQADIERVSMKLADLHMEHNRLHGTEELREDRNGGSVVEICTGAMFRRI